VSEVAAHELDDAALARQRAASEADAALLADRRRQAALRLVRDDDTAPAAGAGPAAPPEEVPLFEATTSALGGDVDAAGQTLVVWSDRVEQRDGRGRVRARLALEAIDQVEVRRRLSSATLVVTAVDGSSLVLKGVKPASAARFRDTVAQLRLADPSSSATPTAEALRRLDELAAMGLLTDKELAEKRSVVAQRGVQCRG
jgi:hypothetical protein